MKKLIISLVLLMGLSFNANAVVIEAAAVDTVATTSSSSVGLSGGFGMPIAFVFFAIMTQEEYRACSDNKMLEGSFSHGKSNHTFNIEPCDYLDNPSKYTLKSS